MLSISSGLRSLPRLPKSTLERVLPPPRILELSIGIPSTTRRAWLDPVMEEPPRITMRLDEPGAPAVEVIFTPDTLPCNAFRALVLCPLVRSELLTTGAE